jgi:hypothetical protein
MKLVPRDHEPSGLGSCAKMLDRESNCGQQEQQPPDEANHTPRCSRCDRTQPDPTRVLAKLISKPYACQGEENESKNRQDFLCAIRGKRGDQVRG